MAEDKQYYAWSPIHYHTGEGDSLERKIAQPGAKVSQNGLGVDDDEWATLLEGGSIRPNPYPKGLDPKNPNALSPNEHRLRQLRLQRERLEAEIAGVGGTPGDTTPSETTEEKATA